MVLQDNADKQLGNAKEHARLKENLLTAGAYRAPVVDETRSFRPRFGPLHLMGRVEHGLVVPRDGSAKVPLKLVRPVHPGSGEPVASLTVARQPPAPAILTPRVPKHVIAERLEARRQALRDSKAERSAAAAAHDELAAAASAKLPGLPPVDKGVRMPAPDKRTGQEVAHPHTRTTFGPAPLYKPRKFRGKMATAETLARKRRGETPAPAAAAAALRGSARAPELPEPVLAANAAAAAAPTMAPHGFLRSRPPRPAPGTVVPGSDADVLLQAARERDAVRQRRSRAARAAKAALG